MDSLGIAGDVPCVGASYVGDQYLPFNVEWVKESVHRTLYVYLHGPDGGYAELKFCANDFSLTGAVVITEPPACDYGSASQLSVVDGRIPSFSRDIWEWGVTPDHERINKNSVDVNCSFMGMDKTDGRLVLVVSRKAPATRYACGDAEVTVTVDGELCAIVIRHASAGQGRSK